MNEKENNKKKKRKKQKRLQSLQISEMKEMKENKKKEDKKNMYSWKKNSIGQKDYTHWFVIADLDRNNRNIGMSGSEISQNKCVKKKRRPTNHRQIGQEEWGRGIKEGGW